MIATLRSKQECKRKFNYTRFLLLIGGHKWSADAYLCIFCAVGNAAAFPMNAALVGRPMTAPRVKRSEHPHITEHEAGQVGNTVFCVLGVTRLGLEPRPPAFVAPVRSPRALGHLTPLSNFELTWKNLRIIERGLMSHMPLQRATNKLQRLILCNASKHWLLLARMHHLFWNGAQLSTQQ